MTNVDPRAPTASLGKPGRLVLVPNTLDLGCPEPVPLALALPADVIRRASTIQHWIVETPKVARAFLKRVGELAPLAVPLQSMSMQAMPAGKGTGAAPADADRALAFLKAHTSQGFDVGLLSDAGLPAVADPGSAVVAAAHAAGLGVDVLVGPNAIALTLAASGLQGQHFTFVGYVPQHDPERSARLRELEGHSKKGVTQIAIEAPYRNAALAQALCQTLNAQTWLCIAQGLTLPQGWVVTRSVTAWRQSPPRFLADVPAVFAWLAPRG